MGARLSATRLSNCATHFSWTQPGPPQQSSAPVVVIDRCEKTDPLQKHHRCAAVELITATGTFLIPDTKRIADRQLVPGQPGVSNAVELRIRAAAIDEASTTVAPNVDSTTSKAAWHARAWVRLFSTSVNTPVRFHSKIQVRLPVGSTRSRHISVSSRRPEFGLETQLPQGSIQLSALRLTRQFVVMIEPIPITLRMNPVMENSADGCHTSRSVPYLECTKSA